MKQQVLLNHLIILVFSGIAGCLSPESGKENDEPTNVELPSHPELESAPNSDITPPPVPKKNITSGSESKWISSIGYTIINTEIHDKLSIATINVRLNKEVDKYDLKKIGYKIKADNNQYSKLWIFYFLKGMTTESAAWAITHFKPTLELEIIGASKVSSEVMKSKKVTGEILSTWIDNDPILPNTKYLVKESGKLFMKSVYAQTKYIDASELVKELTKTTHRGLARYNYKNNHGEYYLIEQNGNLSLYDFDGKFKELKKR